METTQGIKSVKNPAPKLIAPYSNAELAEALVYFTIALDETIDAVFLTRTDFEFLTRERADDLRLLQRTAQIVAEVTSLQLASGDDGEELLLY